MTTPWKLVYQRFNPIRKLEGETLSYFVARDSASLEATANELRLADGHCQILFVGQRGSGKSSELRRLAQMVGDDFFTILVDVDELTDLFNVNHVEVLYLLGASVYGAAVASGHKLDEALLKDLVGSIETLVREQTKKEDYSIDVNALLKAITTAGAAALGGAAAGPVGAAGAAVLATAASIFKDVKFNLGVSDKVVRKLEVKPRITAIVQALNKIVQAVREASGRELLVIVDGLDRVETEQGRLIFAESQVLVQPACHLVYVIPSNLYYSPYLALAKQTFQKVYPLPNVKLHEQDTAEPHGPGYDFMREVIDRRLADLGTDRDALFAPDALDHLIAMSGGLMREFVRIVQSSVVKTFTDKDEIVSIETARNVVDALRRDYIAGLNHALVDELIELMTTGLLSGSEDGDKLLQNLYILCQSNADLWYEVHPILVSYIREEMAKREKSTSDG
jgi:hypothetical protein